MTFIAFLYFDSNITIVVRLLFIIGFLFRKFRDTLVFEESFSYIVIKALIVLLPVIVPFHLRLFALVLFVPALSFVQPLLWLWRQHLPHVVFAGVFSLLPLSHILVLY